MGVNVELQGMGDLLNRTELMGQKTAKVINPILKEAAEPMLEEIQKTTEFIDHSHNLRNAMKMSKVKTIQGVKAIWVGDVDKTANYSWYVEFGHTNKDGKNAPPHPFIRPAFQNNKDTAKQIIIAKLREVLSA